MLKLVSSVVFTVCKLQRVRFFKAPNTLPNWIPAKATLLTSVWEKKKKKAIDYCDLGFVVWISYLLMWFLRFRFYEIRIKQQTKEENTNVSTNKSNRWRSFVRETHSGEKCPLWNVETHVPISGIQLGTVHCAFYLCTAFLFVSDLSHLVWMPPSIGQLPKFAVKSSQKSTGWTYRCVASLCVGFLVPRNYDHWPWMDQIHFSTALKNDTRKHHTTKTNNHLMNWRDSLTSQHYNWIITTNFHKFFLSELEFHGQFLWCTRQR